LLIDLTTGRCWQLNRPGADFVSALEEARSVTDACALVETHYQAPPDVIRRDLVRLAQELSEAGLIERVGK
jgi:hypothetical protein